MIFYFTATGNCLYAAKQLDSELVSIPQELLKEHRHYRADAIGIVCPTYGHEIPPVVKRFIRDSDFETDYFFIIATYGFHHGGCAELTDAFLREVGKKADYINTVIMVDNALPGFDIEEQLHIDPEKQVDAHLAAIRAEIEARKAYIQPATEVDKEHHRVYLNRSGKVEVSKDQPLYQVTDRCIGCGVCTKVCPMGCISIVERKACHDYTDCAGCMACIHACPQMAIRFAVLTEKNPNRHYRNPNIKLSELIQANQRGKERLEDANP